MANIVIYEFQNRLTQHGEVSWPAQKITRTTTASTVVTDAGTAVVLVTADNDCRMTMDGTAASGADIPILSAGYNQFLFSTPRAMTLKFA